VVKAKSPILTKISKGFKTLDIRQRKRGFPELGLKRIPFNPKSEAQTKIRTRYGELVQGWRELTQAERDSWDEKAEAFYISGWNLYVKETWVEVAFKFRVPTYFRSESVAWTPTVNQVWDITTYLEEAGVPLATAKKIMIGWTPSRDSDIMEFELLDEGNVVKHTLAYGIDVNDYLYGQHKPYPSIPFVVDGSVRKISYKSHGGHYHDYSTKFRGLVVWGYEE